MEFQFLQTKFKLFAELESHRGRGANVIDIPSYQYPVLVTFGDLNDPTSIKQVDPNDLAASFGPGYALKKVQLEITSEPVTQGRMAEAIPCIKVGKGCNWHDLKLPYADPLSRLQGAFLRK